jgi:hypothetical protein
MYTILVGIIDFVINVASSQWLYLNGLFLKAFVYFYEKNFAYVLFKK